MLAQASTILMEVHMCLHARLPEAYVLLQRPPKML